MSNNENFNEFNLHKNVEDSFKPMDLPFPRMMPSAEIALLKAENEKLKDCLSDVFLIICNHESGHHKSFQEMQQRIEKLIQPPNR